MQTQSPDPYRACAVSAVDRALRTQPFIEAAEALERAVVQAFDAGHDRVAEFASIEATRIRLFASAVLEAE